MLFLYQFFYQFFQHPFIANAKDPKPILDLLAEFKAEIIEDEIADVNDDTKTEVSCSKTKFSGQKFAFSREEKVKEFYVKMLYLCIWCSLSGKSIYRRKKISFSRENIFLRENVLSMSGIRFLKFSPKKHDFFYHCHHQILIFYI